MSALLDSFRDGYAALRDPEAQELGPGRRQARSRRRADLEGRSGIRLDV